MSLELQDLSYAYGTNPVLKHLNCSIAPGQVVGLLGKNGAGKTTLFRCILSLLTDYHGSVLWNGTDTRSLTRRDMAAVISYVPQKQPAAFSYTAEDMVLMGAAHRLGICSVPGKAETEKCHALFAQFHLDALAGAPFDALSGGEQQLVLLARALMQGGRLLLLDEPTASLDPGNQMKVLSAMGQLAKQGYTVLFSTHDPQQVLWYADSVLTLDAGHSRFGTPREILTPEFLSHLYGISVTILDTPRGKVILPEVDHVSMDH